MPFSQNCRIIGESRDKIVAEFDFSADLSKLPYKAKVSARATLTLTKPKKGNPEIDITGTGTFQREASAEKGADFNTYSIKATGRMKDKNLPPFVAAVLGKPGNVGNIPGPGSAAQAAAGLLFPPLAGVVAHVLQEMLKPKPKVPKVKKYSPAWYAQQYPGRTQEQLAWIMLADAMANTDEPDEEDAESVGDNEKSGGEDYTGSEDGTHDEDEGSTWQDDSAEVGNDEDGTGSAESDEGGDSTWTGDDDTKTGGEEEENGSGESNGTAAGGEIAAGERGTEGDRPDEAGESKEKADESKQDLTEKQGQESGQPELETLTLQVDHTGRTATYVKDLATGEWVNPETGGVLDLERYNKVVAPNFAKDKAFIDEQREKLEKGDTAFDREIREAARARKEAEAKEAYMEKLAKKYGTRDKDELQKIIGEQQQKEQ